jgi:hypothetical protein
MLTVKIGHYQNPETDTAISMTIYECDSVEVIHANENTPDSVRMTWFAASHPTADTTFEKTVVMDSKARFGPCVVFVENSVGKTVQRVTTDKPYIGPTGRKGLESA